MLNRSIHLNPTLFSPDLEMIPTRNGYGEGVVAAGEKNTEVVVLCCDLTESTRSLDFQKKFPDRFVEMGIQEQNMAGVAAGMAKEGKIPFIASYAVFSPGRNWDQVRVSICYNNANVKIVGAHAGISVGPDGATHQALEDIAITRVLPNMTVIVPADTHEARKATIAAAEIFGPVYLRLAREKTPILTTPQTPFSIGTATVLRTGKDATIIGCGPLLYEALLAAEILAGNTTALDVLLKRYPAINTYIQTPAGAYGSHYNASRKKKWTPSAIRTVIKNMGSMDVEVLNCATVQPLDHKTVLASVKKTRRVVTIEEHQITGGLFGAVSELLAKEYPTPICPIGMPNLFGESGEPMELLEKYGMTAPCILEAIQKTTKK